MKLFSCCSFHLKALKLLCAFRNLDASLFKAASELRLRVAVKYLLKTVSSVTSNQHSANLALRLLFPKVLIACHSDTKAVDSVTLALAFKLCEPRKMIKSLVVWVGFYNWEIVVQCFCSFSADFTAFVLSSYCCRDLDNFPTWCSGYIPWALMAIASVLNAVMWDPRTQLTNYASKS